MHVLFAFKWRIGDGHVRKNDSNNINKPLNDRHLQGFPVEHGEPTQLTLGTMQGTMSTSQTLRPAKSTANRIKIMELAIRAFEEKSQF